MKKAEKRNVLKDESGFTLIEIIAVLIILGILAAVAIPKYQDLQEQAGIKAAEGVVAGGTSQLSLSYAKAVLDGTGPAGVTDVQAECDRVAVTGGYSIECTGTNLASDVTVTATHDTNATWTASVTWESPGAP